MPLSDKQFWIRSWLCFFAYAVLASIFIQFILLPYFVPSWHAGHGLLKDHDWVAYHARGVELATFLRNNDWKGWLNADAGWIEPRAISLIYAFIAPEPWALIPFNAFLHATTGLLISFSLLSVFTEDRRTALIGCLPYIFFPSALLWTSQIHKDGANNFAFACYLLGWVLLFKNSISFNVKKLVFSLFLIGFGSYLSWFLRPYLGMVLTICSGFLLFAGVILCVRSEPSEKKVFSVSLLSALVLLVVLYPVTKASSYSGVKAAITEEADNVPVSSEITQKEVGQKTFRLWEKTPYVPQFLEDKAFTLSAVRTGFIGMNLLKPNIDDRVYFYKISDILNYIPQAIKLALFAPFPDAWLNNSSASHNNFFKKIVIVEMLFVYLSTPFFILFFIFNYKKRESWVLFLFNLAILTLFGLTVANLGTLCRFRYFFLMTWVGIGIAYGVSSWSSLRRFSLNRLVSE